MLDNSEQLVNGKEMQLEQIGDGTEKGAEYREETAVRTDQFSHNCQILAAHRGNFSPIISRIHWDALGVIFRMLFPGC